MSDFDFNNAQAGGGAFDIIPNGTIARMIMTIRPGAAGEGGWLKKSQNSDVMMLDCEFVITEGQFRNRKFWQYMVVSGGKVDETGSSVAGNITRSTLRAILENARGINSGDESDDAREKRIVSGYADFNGMEFTGKIGIEKGQNGYADKNKLIGAMPAGSPSGDAKPIGQVAAHVVQNVAKASGVPSWAQ